MVLSKNFLLKRWFHEIFFCEKEFPVFPHCDTALLTRNESSLSFLSLGNSLFQIEQNSWNQGFTVKKCTLDSNPKADATK